MGLGLMLLGIPLERALSTKDSSLFGSTYIGPLDRETTIQGLIRV